MISHLALQLPELSAPPAGVTAIDGSSGLWAITLWTSNRSPLFVSLRKTGVGLSPLGELATECWANLVGLYPMLTLDAFAFLPDRLRALIHVPTDRRAGEVGSIIGRFKLSLARAARSAKLMGESKLAAIWEPGFEGLMVRGPEELTLWRRRIRLIDPFDPSL